jgi:hypothetical protein
MVQPAPSEGVKISRFSQDRIRKLLGNKGRFSRISIISQLLTVAALLGLTDIAPVLHEKTGLNRIEGILVAAG